MNVGKPTRIFLLCTTAEKTENENER